MGNLSKSSHLSVGASALLSGFTIQILALRPGTNQALRSLLKFSCTTLGNTVCDTIHTTRRLEHYYLEL